MTTFPSKRRAARGALTKKGPRAELEDGMIIKTKVRVDIDLNVERSVDDEVNVWHEDGLVHIGGLNGYISLTVSEAAKVSRDMSFEVDQASVYWAEKAGF